MSDKSLSCLLLHPTPLLFSPFLTLSLLIPSLSFFFPVSLPSSSVTHSLSLSIKLYQKATWFVNITSLLTLHTYTFRLRWELDNFTEDLEAAKTNLTNMINDSDLWCVTPSYSKGFPKKCKLSPDGWFQVGVVLIIVSTYR